MSFSLKYKKNVSKKNQEMFIVSVILPIIVIIYFFKIPTKKLEFPT